MCGIPLLFNGVLDNPKNTGPENKRRRINSLTNHVELAPLMVFDYEDEDNYSHALKKFKAIYESLLKYATAK